MTLPIAFETFAAISFGIINPGRDLCYNWHLQQLGVVLEEARINNVKRLLVSMPPRSLKSQCISVIWPAWIMGLNPSCRVMTASYSQRLAEKHASDSRHIMQSDFFRRHFPYSALLDGQNAKQKFATVHHGYRFSTSVGGTATGEGGDYLIIDDPHNPEHIHSAGRRQGVIDWYEQTWCSRLDNKETGVMIIVMQRLHVDDLAGYLLSKDGHGWHNVCLQARATYTQHFYTAGLTFRQSVGSLLQPARGGEEVLARIEQEVGSYNFNAQYLQQPAAPKGNLIQRSWLGLMSAEQLATLSPLYYIHSWDTALHSGEQHDYSVCLVFAVFADNWVVVAVLRDKLAFNVLTERVGEFYAKWQPREILIENKASGQALIQQVQTYYPELPVVSINPKIDKYSRTMQVLTPLEAGKVRVLEADWTEALLAELCSFPQGKHDDQLDALTQFIKHMLQEQAKPRVRAF